LAYSFLAVLVASLLRGEASYRISVVIDRDTCPIGESVTAAVRAPRKLRLPGVIVRYEIPLKTVDGRRLPISFDPHASARKEVPVLLRGAYYAPREFLTVRDAFGFFSAERAVAAEEGPRIIAIPEAREFPIVLEPRAGGEARREEPRFDHSDELTESRKYVPGDDPRRINWKLFGHSGELFVREGDPEPPPRSRCTVLLDASVDPALYPGESGGRAVDGLASLALGLVSALRAAGLECGYGACGQEVASGDEIAAARFFASAPQYGTSSAPNFPALPDAGTRIVVLALPRRPAGDSALDRFLGGKPQAPVEILFWEPQRLARTAETGSLAGRLLFREAEDAVEREPWPDGREAWIDACIAVYEGRGSVGARKLAI
jgi:hypothetical protein